MNRWVAVVAVLALFLSGIAVGALATHLIAERPRVDGPQRGRPMGGGPPGFFSLERLEDWLELTPDQVLRISDILDDSRKKSEEIRHDVRPRLESLMDETKRRIDEVLTPEQRNRLTELRHRQGGRRVDRFLLGGEPHGPRRRPGPDSGLPPQPPPPPPPE